MKEWCQETLKNYKISVLAKLLVAMLTKYKYLSLPLILPVHRGKGIETLFIVYLHFVYISIRKVGKFQ